MKYQEIKKLIGVVATASILTACGTNNEIQDASLDTNKVDSESSAVESSETPIIETRVTVTYEQSATTSDNLTITNDEPQNYEVKDYQRPVFFKYLTDLDYAYTYDADTNSLIHDNTIVSDNVELVEDDSIVIDGVDSDKEIKSIIYAKDCIIGDARPVVKYLRVSDTEVKAKYISLVPSDSKLVSGITFVFNYDYDADTYKMAGLLGVFGEDLSKLETYEGEFDFYSDSIDGDEYCKPGDTVSIKSDTSLFPHFIDDETALLADEDGLLPEGQLEEIDGKTVLRIIHVKHTNDGKTTTDYALAGLDAEKDNVKDNEGKDIDKEKVKKQQTDDEKEAEKKKAEEQKKKDEEAKKKAEEQKKKQEEAKKNSDNGNANKGGGSGSNPSNSDNSGNQGQSTNDPSQTANVFGVPVVGYDPSAPVTCGITGE